MTTKVSGSWAPLDHSLTKRGSHHSLVKKYNHCTDYINKFRTSTVRVQPSYWTPNNIFKCLRLSFICSTNSCPSHISLRSHTQFVIQFHTWCCIMHTHTGKQCNNSTQQIVLKAKQLHASSVKCMKIGSNCANGSGAFVCGHTHTLIFLPTCSLLLHNNRIYDLTNMGLHVFTFNDRYTYIIYIRCTDLDWLNVIYIIT